MKFKALIIIWMAFPCFMASASCATSDTKTIAQRLKSLEKDMPLPYNDALLDVAERYAEKPLPASFLAYEAFVETELRKRDIPLEIKCLPIALSQMKSDFRSGDRCGIWAMPTLVGLRYGLSIDGQIDERYVMQASTRAALDYLCDLHGQYHDWWLCILAYANSPNALQHALVRGGDSLAVWDWYERKLLPDVVVVRDFIACVYAYGDESRRVADPTDEPEKELETTETPQPFSPTTTKPSPTPPKTSASSQTAPQKYTVKKGDTLTKIAHRHHVSVANLKKWNHLKSDRIQEGQKLIVKP